MKDCKKIESAIWDSFKNGDKQSYGMIYRLYYPRLFAYGCKFSGNERLIEDVLQDIFTQFWINRQKLQQVEKLETYLFISFRNRLMKGFNQLNHHRAQMISFHEQRFQLELTVEQVMINADRLYEQQINLRSSIEQLTERQKEVIYLKFYEELSYEEIAQVMNITTKSTYKLLARSISMLRTAYQLKFASLMLSFPFPLMILCQTLYYF